MHSVLVSFVHISSAILLQWSFLFEKITLKIFKISFQIQRSCYSRYMFSSYLLPKKYSPRKQSKAKRTVSTASKISYTYSTLYTYKNISSLLSSIQNKQDVCFVPRVNQAFKKYFCDLSEL